MKIAYLNPTGQLGGAETALLSLIAGLQAAQPEYDPHLILAAPGPLEARAKALRIPVTILPYPTVLARLGDAAAGGPAGRQFGKLGLLLRILKASYAIASYIPQLRRALQQLEPDLIHTNGFKMHLLGLWARPSGMPVVWHIHDYISARPLMARLMRRYARHCAAIITNSRSVAEDTRALAGNTVSIYPVHNSIDLENFSPTGKTLDLDALAGLPAAPPNVVRVALFSTMAKWKGQEVFLRALSLLPSDLPVRGYIVGGSLYQTDGSQYSIDELRNVAVQLGVQGKVGFTGFVDDPAAAMRACDILAHTSTVPEPFGLVIVEGMASGRPVIISQAGGAAELVQVGETALAHRPGDAVGLADCMQRLAADAALRQQLGNAGRCASQEQFTQARMAKDLLPIYESVLLRSKQIAPNKIRPLVVNEG